jgi:hypothetical protein
MGVTPVKKKKEPTGIRNAFPDKVPAAQREGESPTLPLAFSGQ